MAPPCTRGGEPEPGRREVALARHGSSISLQAATPCIDSEIQTFATPADSTSAALSWKCFATRTFESRDLYNRHAREGLGLDCKNRFGHHALVAHAQEACSAMDVLWSTWRVRRRGGVAVGPADVPLCNGRA